MSIPKFSEEIGEKYPFAQMGITSEVVKATIESEGNEHPVKAWMVAGTNLIQTLPQRDKTIEAINALDFLVVIDTMPMEITGYADVVLPECTYLERYDGIRSATNRTPSIAVRIPAVKPKYDSKPAWWISKQIGERLGLGEFFNYDDYEEVIEWQLNKLGTSLEEMKKIGVKNFDRTSGPLYLQEDQDYQFFTPSGKIEFYSQQLANKGFDPIPVYTKHPEPPQGFYRLNYGRSPMHTFSRTINNPHLSDLKAENTLWVNPKAARILKLKKDQEVWLKNQDGIASTFPIKVRITERIRWDSVYMYHGFGHNEKKLSRAFGKGISDTEMISQTAVDPLMGGTGLRGNFVSILTENPHKKAEI
ncbi:MAG: molybdopterin-dependent oxidoreductase [Salinimicrobium sediminis]|nr:molybdopterin-dependent oxidoreductase [Salinimicrobium sediminis]